MTEECIDHSRRLRDCEILQAKQCEQIGHVQKDITVLGNTMRREMNEFKKETKQAINGMLVKTGILVTICTSIVMAVFKVVENG